MLTVFLQVPAEILNKCRLSYIEQGDPVPLQELGMRHFDDESADHVAYIESCIQGMLKVREHLSKQEVQGPWHSVWSRGTFTPSGVCAKWSVVAEGIDLNFDIRW